MQPIRFAAWASESSPPIDTIGDLVDYQQPSENGYARQAPAGVLRRRP